MKTRRNFFSKRVDSLGRRLPASRRARSTPAPVADGLLRKEHVAGFLGVTVATVDRWRSLDPTFPKAFLLVRTPVWKREEIDAWLSSKREAVPSIATG
jgi:predicted DNA-binding transcriptional regulator AlpA